MNFSDYDEHDPIIVADLFLMPEMLEMGLIKKEFDGAVKLRIIYTIYHERKVAVHKHQVRKFIEWVRKKRLEDAEAMSIP
jgi:hypothetical protein